MGITMKKQMYSYSHGIIDVEEDSHGLRYWQEERNYACYWTLCGRAYIFDKYPSLISLEDAQKLGLVRQVKRFGPDLRVMYEFVASSTLYITEALFNSDWDFYQQTPRKYFKFISFVDKRLNKCEPPSEVLEWEEITK
jgi:hypothetical protein